MAIIFKKISVDVATENIFQSIVAKQYDTDSRFLTVQLTNEGENLAVDTTSTVVINALREDNEAKAFAGSVNEDGTVTVPITSWMLDLDGTVKCDISIYEAERKLTSTTFTISVEAASYAGNDITEDENYDVLVTLIAECQEIIDNASQLVITVDSELSADSTNPVQNRAVAEAIKNSKPMLITFNNSDFDNSDTEHLPTNISFSQNGSRILLTVTFDVSRMNFSIPDGSDYSIHKVLVQGEPFDLSMLDNYIKSMESFTQDYGEGWIVEGSQYVYMHEYSFGTEDNANTVFAELSEMGLNGFQLLVNNYNKITAQEV